MENNTNKEETLVDNAMNLTLAEKGKLAFLKNQEENDDRQIAVDKDRFRGMIELANKRFGGEFSWEQSRKQDFYLITNLEARVVLGGRTSTNLQYIKECKDCGQLINSVEVYLHDLPLVKDGTIRFYHRCVDKQSSPEDTLVEALENYVVNIVEDYAH